MRRSTTSLTGSIGLALVLAAAAPTAPLAAQTAAAASSVVQVNTGRGRLVKLSRPMSDLFVADDQIADVQVRSPTQLYIFGKKSGETTISATAKGGAVVYASTVRVGNNFDSIGAMLGLAMPEAKIVATPMNGLVLLTGTVAAPADVAEAERLVQAFVGEGAKVLSRLRTATPLQVNLQVRIAEVSRSFVKNIGVNLQTRDTTGGFNFSVGSGRQPGALSTTDLGTYPNARIYQPGTASYVEGPYDVSTGTFVNPRTTSVANIANGAERTTLGLAGRLLGLDVLSAIDLGETIGQVTTLANPNLTSLSGETATFLAGGEIPIPVSQGLGAVSVEFKQYGVSLAYTPTVLSDGRISLRVRPEVSQLSAAGAVQLNGVQIPALTTRRAETTVELGSGQSLMIGGLLSNNHQNSIQKAPGIGDLPLIGALFRSNGFQRNETELVIVITPYLVKPVDSPNQIALPTDGYETPTDVERVLLGKMSGGRSGEQRPVPTMRAPAPAAPAAGGAVPTPAGPAAPPPAREVSMMQPQKAKKGSAAMPGFSQ